MVKASITALFLISMATLTIAASSLPVPQPDEAAVSRAAVAELG